MRKKQQFILIDSQNGRQQLVQMQSEPTQAVAQPQQSRIASNDQPVKKVRRIEHIENRSGKFFYLFHVWNLPHVSFRGLIINR